MDRLPDELLAFVFDYTCRERDRQQLNTASIFPLLLVCRRWMILTTPLLYRKITLLPHAVTGTVRINSLQRVLKTEAELWRLVQEFDISILDEQEETCIALAKLVALCRAVKRISLRTQWIRTHPLLDAIRNIPSLRSLALSSQSGCPSQILMYQFCAKLSRLQHLRLECCGVPKEDGTIVYEWPWPPWNWNDPVFQPPFYPQEALTKIELCDPIGPPSLLECFLSRFASLKSFSLLFNHVNRSLDPHYAELYTRATILDLISKYRETIEYVHLGCPPPTENPDDGDSPSWDFRDFPELTELRTSMYELVTWPSANDQDAAKYCRIAGWQISSPNLKRVVLDFNG